LQRDGGSVVFQQLLTPISGNLALSFAVAALPIAVVLVMLGVLRRPAWQLQLNPILFAATNASGGVMGKMISPKPSRSARILRADPRRTHQGHRG
jgi:hypothetical protein